MLRQGQLLTIILSALTGLLVLSAEAAVPATPSSNSKAKQPPKKSTATTSKAPAPATARKSTKGVAAARKPAPKAVSSASKGAVYSRTRKAPVKSGASNRRSTVSRTNWQTRPTQDRYKEIQQALADKGYFKGEVNGVWSSDSVAALKDFQRAENLEPDGKLGSLSLIAMGLGPKRIVAENQPPPTQPQQLAPAASPSNGNPPPAPPDNPPVLRGK